MAALCPDGASAKSVIGIMTPVSRDVLGIIARGLKARARDRVPDAGPPVPTMLTSAALAAYTVSMTALGEFEVFILLAVLHLGEDAYPPAVRAEIERRARRPVARGAVYVTLDRLEAKKLLSSRVADDSGRVRRCYRVSPKGLRAVRQALSAVERMRQGLEPLLNES